MSSPYTGPFKLELEQLVAAKYFNRDLETLDEAQKEDLSHHIDGRYSGFRLHVLPWLKRHVNLSDATVVEVGSGSGASTHAFLSEASHVHCFEIHDAAADIAEYRLRGTGFVNYTLHRSIFDETARNAVGMADGVLLSAVLEHTTFDECTQILRNAWSILRPGGWLCVIDTPNRLCPFDHHTSFLPFFSMLPAEVRLAYAENSPRADFAAVFRNNQETPSIQRERLTRWGAGISYHEFEIAIGPAVHEYVIADGYEDEISGWIGVTEEDDFADALIKRYAPYVHKAFSRRALFIIFRKP